MFRWIAENTKKAFRVFLFRKYLVFGGVMGKSLIDQAQSGGQFQKYHPKDELDWDDVSLCLQRMDP